MTAPVVVFAYNRADKLKNCIDSLMACDGREKTTVYIYADGAAGDNDRPAVNKVREYLDSLENNHVFAGLTVIRRDSNNGLADNIISGVTEVINRHERVIVLEDDLIATRDFLTYMNSALDFYEKDPDIWSITGFTWPVSDFARYKHDVYYSYRGCSIGWGTWKNRWDTVDWAMENYEIVLSDRKALKKFERGGKDMTRILKDQKSGIVNSWAIRWCLSQSLQECYTVYPTSSLVLNTGNDGSGTHDAGSPCPTAAQHVEGKKIKLEHLAPDAEICRAFYNYHSNLFRRIIRNLNPAGIRRQVRRLAAGHRL